MARAKVKITPLDRKMQTNRQRSWGLKKSKCQEPMGRDQDTENCSPNLDYNVIEQIANGVEKMMLSWSHLDEGEEYHKKGVIKDEKLVLENKPVSAMWTLPTGNEIQEHPEEEAVMAEIPGGITTEMSLDGSCPGEGTGHAISNIVTEAVNHRRTRETSDARTGNTLTKAATYWCLEASNVPPEKSIPVCTEETSEGNTDAESPAQTLHQKRSREVNKLTSKDISILGQSPNTHSSPRTPPISERSVKRVQSQERGQEDSSNKMLQLSVSKKTPWSEKATGAPIRPACYSEDEDCIKSPGSDCSLLDLLSNSSWNDPLVGSPCQKPSTLLMDGGQVEEFGPWDTAAGHPPVLISRVTERPDSDFENCTKEKTSFVSFKLWKANKQSETENGRSGKIESNEEKLGPSDTIVLGLHQDPPDDHERQDCGVAAQSIVAPPTSEAVSNGDTSTGEVEELQIALLECATEYEIKTIEMKMKLKNIKNLKGEPLFLDSQSTPSDVSDATVAGANKTPHANNAQDHQPPEDDLQQLEKVKRQVCKLQHQKGCLSKELTDLRKKERQFELQKKSLDAALHKLDRLEWVMVRKEQEVEDWQLRQRHAEVQLQNSAMELQRLTNLGDLASLPVDTASLLSLLPTLRGFVQNLAQKDNGGEYCSDDQSQQDEGLCDSTQVDEIVSNLMYEIQSLQHELNGMVSEEPKLKKVTSRQTRINMAKRDQCGHKNPKTRPSPRLPRIRYPYEKL